MIELTPTHIDDPQFVQLASQVLNKLIRLHLPSDVYAIEIDHWFDHKWLQFSGQTLGALPFWRWRLTIPPFDPGRVVSQKYFHARNAGREIYDEDVRKPLHRDQWSGHNVNRYIKDISASGIFFWYSGDTNGSDRAALMVYLTSGEEAVPWYASFTKTEHWRLNKVRGISRVKFENLAA
jgi:hypothetical protein